MSRPTRTQLGDYQVWFCPARQQLRQTDASGHGDHEFEVEAFTRPQLAQAHAIHAAARSAL